MLEGAHHDLREEVSSLLRSAPVDEGVKAELLGKIVEMEEQQLQHLKEVLQIDVLGHIAEHVIESAFEEGDQVKIRKIDEILSRALRQFRKLGEEIQGWQELESIGEAFEEKPQKTP